jgi:HlyD family secretion protein
MLKISVVLLPALILLTSCAKKEAEETEGPAPVQVTSVTETSIRRIVTGDGVLFPRDQASVMPKIAAPVQKFLVNRGSHVKAGELLATLEHADLTAAVGAAQGAVAQADANYRSTASAAVPESVVKAVTDVQADQEQLDAAKRVLASRQKLVKEGALAQKLVDDQQVLYAQAKAQLEAAQEHLRALQDVAKGEQIKAAAAQLESAKAQLQSAQAQLSYAEIHSPIDGVIADRPLYAGEMATPGAPLLTVMDVSRVVARVNVPQGPAATVKVGDAATLTQVESGQEVPGKVTVVSPATDTASTTLQVWIEAANPDAKLKPGASVHAVIVTELIKNAMVVPVAAILPGEEGGTSVLTVASDSRVHRRKVDLGVHEGDKVQLLSGVRPGEEVVIKGGMGVDDKAKVKVLSQAEEDEDEDEDEDGAAAPAAKKDEAKPKAQ